MSKPLPIDQQQITAFLTGLLNTPSPTSFTERAVAYTEAALAPLPLTLRRTHKGALVAEWPGLRSDAPRALTAHLDTLGAMVKEIKDSGRLRLSKIGGWAWNTVEGEGCTIFTAAGATVRGTLLIAKASSHVHGPETSQMKREDDTMEVRLDERTTSAAQTRALGIQVGDVVAFDPRVETGPAGFIRSRHLDDKASVAAIFGAIQAMLAAGVQPAQRTTVLFSTYEEVGHGAAAGIPADVVELVAVDMAAIGQGQESDEFHVTICAKDSGGPYDYGLRRRLAQLADEAGIPYKLDIYPFYGSDGEAFWRAGGDVRVGLVGPGVEASHNYERTHVDALVGTAQLLVEYLRSPGMTLRIRAIDAQVWTIAAHGRIDLPAARAIEDAISELCDAGRAQLVVDLADVVYMASAGLAALLTGVRRARLLKGDVRLAAMNARVREVFEMSGFDQVFTIYGSLAEAVASFGAGGEPPPL